MKNGPAGASTPVAPGLTTNKEWLMLESTCSIGNCNERVLSRGWCSSHYNKWHAHGDPEYVKPARVILDCIVDGCERPSSSLKLCTLHYNRQNATGDVGPPGRITAVNIGSTCSGPECSSPATRKGLCDSHYRMQRRTGKLIPIKHDYREWHRGLDDSEVLEARALPPTDLGCRVWAGEVNASGYPKFPRRAKNTRQAHRISYMISNGVDVPSHIPIHHTCGNKLCVESSHLQAVTPIENTAEMLERNFYLTRIAKLEEALMDLTPSHPLLESVK